MNQTPTIPVIRPRSVFQLVEQQWPGQNVEISMLMPPSGIGSLLTLESALVAALVKITSAESIFEFGTFHGSTTVMLAANSGPRACITSLDLPQQQIAADAPAGLNLADADQNDQFLRLMYRDRGPYCVSQARAELQQKIRLITEDSRTFCPEHAGLAGSQDLVLVDGGHDFDTQMNDSLKAFQLGKPDSVIIWHDYGSAIHTDVARCLQELSASHSLVSIGSTMLCLCLQGRFARMGLAEG